MTFEKKPFVLFVLLLTLASCSPYAQLTNAFNSSRSSLGYLHPGALNNSRNTEKKIFVERPVVDHRFTTSTRIKKQKIVLVPLILVNFWDYRYECFAGQTVVKENVSDFIRSSVVIESARTGTFLADTTAAGDYSLEIAVDSLVAKGPFRSEGYYISGLFKVFSRSETTGPTLAYSRFWFRLKKGTDVLHVGVVSSESSLGGFLAGRNRWTKNRNNRRNSLVESLGDTFRQNIEKIIVRINEKLAVN